MGLMDAESAMQAEMREIIETDEKRNDLESYIFTMRDRTSEGGEYGEYITSADREKFASDLKKAGDPVVWRKKESEMRPEWIQAVNGTITNYRSAAQNPGEKFGHIAPEKLASIVTACNQLEKWLNDTKAKQETMPKAEKPILLCVDMETKNQELAKMADDIMKEPKPAPPKEEKKEEEKKDEEKKEEEKGEEPAKDANDVD